MNSEKYIGLDVRQATISVAVLDPNSASLSHQAAIVGLQRTGPGDQDQCGILLCGRPTAALQETAFHSRSE